ncbi:MAG TPA: hypothetical protein VK210_05860 [Terriglobia bacterium]|nr:hypothetical protein [Terriglobia bacterium]
MKRGICVVVLGVVFLLGASVAQAASVPAIDGQVAGIELCPQFICGAAIFAGGFQGKIGINPNASAVMVAALKHGDLPTEIGQSTPIYTGVWELRNLFRRFSGAVLGGEIVYIGQNRFHVTATLLLTSGGGGVLHLDGILDHNPLIPTFGGTLQ